MTPKVSVIIPAYNEEKYIAKAIKSVLKQDFEDFEVLIINDFSTDDTSFVVKKMEKIDDRVKLIELCGNLGRAGAINIGLSKAQGEYIAFLDGDDLMAEGRLSGEVELLEENNDIDLVYTNAEVLDEDGSKTFVDAIEFESDPREILVNASKNKSTLEMKPAEIINSSEENRYIPGGTVMVRKNVFDNIKLDNNLKNSEDYDLWFQIIGAGFKIAKLPIIGFSYRKNPNQKSSNKEKMKIAAEIIANKLVRGEYFK